MGRRTKGFKRWSMRRLGIPEIRSNAKYRAEGGRADGIFFDRIPRLVELVQEEEMEKQNLESRHRFFMAVIESGPYAIITSIVALSWALSVEKSVVIPAAVVAAGVIGVVILCNRLDSKVESALVNSRMNLDFVKDRLEFRDREVKEALLDYNAIPKPPFFAASIQITFRILPQLKDMVRGWMPDLTSEVANNIMYRHPNAFGLMKALEREALAFLDVAERFSKRTTRLLASQVKEDRKDLVTWELLFCMTHKICAKEDLQAAVLSNKISGDESATLSELFDRGHDVHLNDKELRQMASDVESHRALGEKIARDIEREISVLYGVQKKT